MKYNRNYSGEGKECWTIRQLADKNARMATILRIIGKDLSEGSFGEPKNKTRFYPQDATHKISRGSAYEIISHPLANGQCCTVIH